MDLNDKIKKEVDLLPEEQLHQLELYLEIIKSDRQKAQHIRSLHLNGSFDNLNILKLAY